jgi:hypothetical protein
VRIKPPRIKEKSKTRRPRYVNIRLHDDEHRALEAKAKVAGITKSELIREHIGRIRITPRADRRAMLLTLARIAGSLKQLSRWALAHQHAADAVAICARLIEVHDELTAVERRVGRRKKDEP